MNWIFLINQAVAIRTLIIGASDRNSSFSQFLSSLKASEHSLEFASKQNAASISFVQSDLLKWDNVAVLDPSVPSFGGLLKVGSLLDYVNNGGNLLLGNNDHVSDAVRDFAIEFSVDYANAPIKDYAAKNDLEARFVGSKSISSVTGGIYFKGNTHRVSGKNPLIQPLLVAPDSSFVSSTGSINEKAILGSRNIVASGFQSLNNARVVFANVDLFKDNYFDR